MKNFSFILNIVLLGAVGILYYLHFKGKSGTENSSETATPVLHLPSGNSLPAIVFINTDSLIDKYEFSKITQQDLKSKNEKIRAELKAEKEKFQKDVEAYQEKAAGMTDQQRMATEEQLSARQSDLMSKSDKLMGQLDDQRSKSTEELYSRLTAYLKKYNKDKHFQFILGFQPGGGILLANDSLDITSAVVDGLNKEYKPEGTR